MVEQRTLVGEEGASQFQSFRMPKLAKMKSGLRAGRLFLDFFLGKQLRLSISIVTLKLY